MRGWCARRLDCAAISRNSQITAGLFAFLFSRNDFLFALTLTTTEEVRPVTLSIYQYLGTRASSWSAVMATAVLSSSPAIALLMPVQEYIAAGATGGARQVTSRSGTLP